MADTAEYIRALLAAQRFARQVTCHEVLEEEPAQPSDVSRPWSPGVRDVLAHMGLASLYCHQAEACDAVRAGHDVIVTTPTASGKSLVYNLPFLERFEKDPQTTALYLFPLKALAQDQKGTLDAMTAHWPASRRPRTALYDGDVSDWGRAKIRKNPPNVLITNPDMLHLGIMPHHERWAGFFEHLSFIVLDEAHTYRGVFGAHMAGVLQRLGRIAGIHGAHPVHILCTATLGNPAEFGRLLLGSSEPPLVVSRSGAPRGRRNMVFMNPEDSPATLAINLLQAALYRGLRTIVYCRSRRMTELVSLWTAQKASRYQSRISAYRAGFLPEERREIEAKLASGELLAVVSTSALELGIDIGSLDVCILVGYPGSVMSTLQRGGRVGRKGQESAVILVGGEDALDQYFINNPQEFFKRPPECVFLNPDNAVILPRHVECAAAERPLTEDETWLSHEAVRDAVAGLAGEGLLLQSEDGNSWFAARRNPHRGVNLRGTGHSFTLIDEEGRIIGTLDGHRAFREAHEGAVYLHRGRSYVVTGLDIGGHKAVARREEVRWHTNVRTEKSTEILSTYAEGRAFGCPVFFGRLRVTEKIVGYERRENGSMTLIDITPLEIPPQIFETEGLWYAIPEEVRLQTENGFYHFMGSIHALEHVSIGLMPLLVMCDRNDLGGISIPMHNQVGGAAVFVYDGLPGGAGLTAMAYPRLCDLMLSVRHTLRECPCENGCPSCIQSPKCGAGNRPLDKQGALFLVETLIGADEEEGRRRSYLPMPSRERIREINAERARKEAGKALEDAGTARNTEASVARKMSSDAAAGGPLQAVGEDDVLTDPFAEETDPFADGGKEGTSEPKAEGLVPSCRADASPCYSRDGAGMRMKHPRPSGRSGTSRWPSLGKSSFSAGRPCGTGTAEGAFPGRGYAAGEDAQPATSMPPAMQEAEFEAFLQRKRREKTAEGAVQEEQPAGRNAGRNGQKDVGVDVSSEKSDEGNSGCEPVFFGALCDDAVDVGTEEAVPEKGAALSGVSAGKAQALAVDVEEPAPSPDPGRSGPVMVFDVETRRSAQEVGGWDQAARMGVSVMVCWDGTAYRSFLQEELSDFFELVKGAGLVVGFNSFRFDYKVLQPFCPYDLHSLPGLDMLQVIRRHLGYPVSLDNLGRATLDAPKSADGLQALRWWKEGRIEDIRAYCTADVEITRSLYAFGREHGYLLFTNKAGQKVRVPVHW